jgi:2-desacetyl-2-hydroxyethyl bacteriochlorophyllide A dehydrogenase
METATIVFPRPREVVVESRALPEPAPGELLIQTRLSLISTGTELTILAGDFPSQSFWAAYGKFPFVAGYSNVGIVREVGDRTDRSWIGRRVATRTPHAAWTIAKAADAVAIPDQVADERAVFFALAGIVMNAVRRGRVRWGEAVVIFGLGLLGQLAVRLCELCGARRVFAVDVAAPRLALLPDKPAISAVNARTEDPGKVIRDRNHGRLADVAFEVTGDPKLIAGEFAALRRQGRFVVLSSPRGPSAFDFHDLCNAPSFTIIGAHEMSHPAHETYDHPWTRMQHYRLFFDYVLDGRLDPAPLLSDRVAYREAPSIYSKLLTDRASHMGVALDWS